MTKLVFFDLDGTLIDNPSSEILFFFFLLKKHYFGWKQFGAWFMFLCRWFWRFKSEIFIKNKAYFSGLVFEDIKTQAINFTKQKLLAKVNQGVKQRLDEHLQNKDIVVLLTGSPEFIADIFADFFGVHDLYATNFAINARYFSNAPLLQHPYAQEKLTIARMVCDKYQVKITDTIAYANSIHDYALLNSCGTPVAVTPDKKLRRIAVERNWEIVD